jgi:hypothetical protein
MSDRAATDAPPSGAASRPSSEEARAWVGFTLDEMSGAGIGRVEGVYVDATDRRPEWLLVRRGRLGQCCLVPARVAVGVAGHVWAPWDRATIRTSSEIEPGTPLTVGEELELCAHYGIGEGVGRAAELRGWPRADMSALPI